MGDKKRACFFTLCFANCFDRVLLAGPPVMGGTTMLDSTGEATVMGLKNRLGFCCCWDPEFRLPKMVSSSVFRNLDL
jgi:hypothetical protein